MDIPHISQYSRLQNHIGGNVFNIFILLIIVYIFAALSILVLVKVGKNNIRQNWVKYRCNPVILPFAQFFGKDPQQAAAVCTGMVANTQSKKHMSPFKSQLSGTVGILGRFLGVFNGLRMRASAFRGGLLSFFEDVLIRIQTLGTIAQYTFVKTSEVMRKNYGLFLVSLYSALATMDTFKSIMNGPIGDVAGFLCFKGNTEITLADGNIKKIKDICIGDNLYSEAVSKNSVISIMEFSSQNVDMYKYCDVTVSGSHLVYENNRWIRVEDSQMSNLITSTQDVGDKIYCLTATNNTISVGNILFRDYIELNNSETNNLMKKTILTYLNNAEYEKRISIGNYYNFGFGKETEITMVGQQDNTFKSINTLCIGDKTIDGAVTGIIKLVNTGDVYTDGVSYFSGNNIILYNNTWDLVCNVGSKFRYCGHHTNVLYHITTESGQITLRNNIKVRDFEETNDPVVNDTIDSYIINKINGLN